MGEGAAMSGSSNGDGRLPAFAPRRDEPDTYGFADLSLAELRELWAEEMRPKDEAGECCCPVFEDGSRGFRQRCPVHGGRSRADFARLTALAAEVASRCRVEAVPAGSLVGAAGRDPRLCRF